MNIYVLDVLEEMIMRDRAILQGILDIVGYVYFQTNLTLSAYTHKPIISSLSPRRAP